MRYSVVLDLVNQSIFVCQKFQIVARSFLSTGVVIRSSKLIEGREANFSVCLSFDLAHLLGLCA